MSNQPTELPDGFHDLDDAVYHSLPFASKHALDVIREKSPMHLAWQRTHPQAPTEAMKFGSAFHTAILEPDEFEQRHPIAGQCEMKTAKGDPCKNSGIGRDPTGAWLCGVHAKGRSASPVSNAIDIATAEQITAMRNAIMNHRAARAIIEGEGENELALLWHETVAVDGWTHDVRCKLKCDMVRPQFDALADLKTCENASPAAIEKAIENFGYARQAAYYLDAFARAGRPMKYFVLVCVEKAAPCAVATYRIKEDDIALAREQNAKTLAVYAACDRTGDWYGYSDSFEDIGLPAWAFKRAMQTV